MRLMGQLTTERGLASILRRRQCGTCHGIGINDQWRLCFRFVDGNAYDAEIVDYH